MGITTWIHVWLAGMNAVHSLHTGGFLFWRGAVLILIKWREAMQGMIGCGMLVFFLAHLLMAISACLLAALCFLLMQRSEMFDSLARVLLLVLDFQTKQHWRQA
jgi:hypothetical protein